MIKRLGVFGVGSGINGRDAAMQATQQALDQLGSSRPVLALVFASQEFNIAEVQVGLNSLLGDTPLWGFSTWSQSRTVVVALLAGADCLAAVKWFPSYAQDSAGAAHWLAQVLRQDVFLPQHMLIAADGIGGSLLPMCAALAELPVNVSGCTASGDPTLAYTQQLGGNQFGPGGLAVALLDGRFRVGNGLAHGWRDLGVGFRATRCRDVWLQELDGAPAVETYARWFGFPARDWVSPPLRDLARLYPLRVEPEPGQSEPPEGVQGGIRSPLAFEMDGSLRMSAPVPEGAVVHLLSGDPDACLQSARAAARQALDSLDKGAHPLLAIAFADAAWQALFEASPTALSAAISAELEDAQVNIPLVLAATFGQLVRPALNQPPVLHNQALSLLIIAEAQE